MLLATAELRKRRQNHARETSIPGKRLAAFLASAEAHEVLLAQRLHDAEAQDVFAQMGGVQRHESGEQLLDEQAAYRLRVRLGLETGPTEHHEQGRQNLPSPRRGSRIGQRKPTRDPVKKESAC